MPMLSEHCYSVTMPGCLRLLVPAGEDDGFLLVYVTQPSGQSFLHVYDAATMDSKPLAEVGLVSCGFKLFTMNYLNRLFTVKFLLLLLLNCQPTCWRGNGLASCWHTAPALLCIYAICMCKYICILTSECMIPCWLQHS